MSNSLIRPKYAAAKAGISVSHMYRLINRGDFPTPIRVSDRISAFVESELDTWVSNQITRARSTNKKTLIQSEKQIKEKTLREEIAHGS